MASKIDSNLTGLRFAEESDLRTLPGSPVWYPLEPNSYNDFGGQLATVARNPINPSRQRKKGVVTDLDASGGFNQDLTFANFTRLAQGFFFADIRAKVSTAPLNATAIACTSVVAATDKYNFGSNPGTFPANSLILASGFGVAGNNGVKLGVSSDADDVTTVDGLVDEASPPATAKLQLVGFQLGSGTSSISLNGNYVRLNDTGNGLDTWGLIPGEWVALGSDTGTQAFANNVGFARIKTIAAGYLEFDKTTWEGAVEAGTGKTIRVWMGDVLKNESVSNLIKRRTYQVERTLGQDADGTMSEYLVGAVPNELTVNIAQADKVTLDMSFVAVDNEQRSGLTGVKSGTRPTLLPDDAYNTSSDFYRIKLALVDATDSSPSPLFAYATEMSLTVNNNVSPNKAIAVLGAFDTSAGTFEVGGNLTAYFADIAAVQAVRNNADVTLDAILTKANKGLLFDIPLLSLGDGRLAVEQDQAITLPLETNAAESSFGHTFLYQSFSYLPNVLM